MAKHANSTAASEGDNSPSSGLIPFPTIGERAFGGTLIQTVNARDLHRFLLVGKQFGTWITDRIGTYGFVEHTDYEVFAEIGGNSEAIVATSLPEIGKRVWGGQNRKEYAVTLDMAKELAMVERNDQGKKARLYFIECERKLRAAPPPAPEAGIGDLPGAITIREAAKVLGERPSVLMAYLRKHAWIYGGPGVPPVGYADKVDAGYLTHTAVNEKGQIEVGVRVTSKGLARLGECLPKLASEPLPGFVPVESPAPVTGPGVLKLVSRANDDVPCAGCFYLRDFDPAYNNGLGDVLFVKDWEAAKVFESLATACAYTEHAFDHPHYGSWEPLTFFNFTWHPLARLHLAKEEQRGNTSG